MKKIVIIAPNSLSYVPYLTYYEDILQEKGVPYDLLFWDRHQLDEEGGKGGRFSCKSSTNGLGSIRGYFGFRRFLLNKLNEHEYSFHIILTSQIGVLLYRYLKNKKYLLDIRDFSHESNPIYKSLTNRLVNDAVSVTISSDGFRQWLPTGIEYLISHNILLDKIHKIGLPPRFNPDNLHVSYIGAVGYYKPNLRVIKAVANCPKIKLRYIGSGTCENELRGYCIKEIIGNVEYSGRYMPAQKPTFYEETDFVLACYGQNSLVERTSIPNRLYESSYYGRPIIVNTGTYLAELVRKHGLGIVLDLDDIGDLFKKLIPYSDPEVYRHYLYNCETFLNKVADDVFLFRTTVRSLLKEIK